MKKRKSILVIDDEPSLRQVIEFQLTEAGYQVLLAEGGLRGYESFTENAPDLVITDIQMPEMDGTELTKRIKAVAPDTPIVIITAYGDIQSAVAAIKGGAEDYLTKPLNWDELNLIIERAFKVKALVNENRELRAFIGERFRFENIIGTSKRMQELYGIVERVAQTEVIVLLLGESGTGKEVIAKTIHQHGSRRDKSFVAINCGAIPENLLESELFGYRKGAFTGAIYDKPGLFEKAHGGTIFLDEIGEMPLGLQVALLRVLQDGEFLRLGDSTPRRVNIRVIAATNRDLAKRVADGSFREDLYFRLNIVPIKMPPLRERREDIPLLTNSFLQDATSRYGRTKLRLAADVYSHFHKYPWPGNVRELKNTVERLAVLANGEIVSADELPDEIKNTRAQADGFPFNFPDEGIDLEEVEKEIIRQALEKNDWNQTQTAKYLNITRNTLIYRMQKFNFS